MWFWNLQSCSSGRSSVAPLSMWFVVWRQLAIKNGTLYRSLYKRPKFRTVLLQLNLFRGAMNPSFFVAVCLSGVGPQGFMSPVVVCEERVCNICALCEERHHIGAIDLLLFLLRDGWRWERLKLTEQGVEEIIGYGTWVYQINILSWAVDQCTSNEGLLSKSM